MDLHLEIVTPEGSVVDTQAQEVILPGKLGEFGVLDGHIPFLSALRPGVVRYQDAKGPQRLAISTGFAEVGAGNHVLVLTDNHALEGDIDADSVKGELADLESRLQAWDGPLTPEHTELTEDQEWAEAQLQTKSGNH